MNCANATITIRDLAEAAGVSVFTVPRVLDEKATVTPETLRKVRALVDELGYRSDLAARGLRNHRTHTIPMVVSDVEKAFSAQVIKGVNRVTAF